MYFLIGSIELSFDSSSYITNLSKEEDKFILETPYDIMTENFTNVNMQVKDTIIQSINTYKKKKKKYSNALLALLWYYEDNDDIICQIEEMNRPIYEPMADYNERKRLEQIEKDKRDFTKKLKNNLNKIQENNKKNISGRQIVNEQKKIQEEKLKNTLAERRRIAQVMSGLEYSYNRYILNSSTKFRNSN